MERFRNEWKYICNEYDLTIIEQRLKKYLQYDENSCKDGQYAIHSLYFDDAYYSCASDNDAGLPIRYKYRIRYYGQNQETLKLEKKYKYYGMCRKRSISLSLNEYQMIMTGNAESLMWKTNSDLLKLFCSDIVFKGYSPKLIVDYERRAFVDYFTNVRITFDRNIAISSDISKFLERDYEKIPLMGENQHILEVKFDDILPAYIKQAAYISTLNQTAFSKYGTGIQVIERLKKYDYLFKKNNIRHSLDIQ